MRKAVTTFAVLAMLFCTVSLKTHADDKAMSWTGWISDSHCGAKGMSADHKACAQTCVKTKGASYVFVTGADKKVVNIHNQDAIDADKDLGTEVKITGHMMDDGSVHIDKIAPKS
ncbi:MAG TPA: hypothetical protein VK757_09785 [Candidatus Acidoferrum sp.]|jgi:hypothetical protein|nr:hypothetical protein [Candidatus Acidoferrum sp.]